MHCNIENIVMIRIKCLQIEKVGFKLLMRSWRTVHKTKSNLLTSFLTWPALLFRIVLISNTRILPKQGVAFQYDTNRTSFLFCLDKNDSELSRRKTDRFFDFMNIINVITLEVATGQDQSIIIPVWVTK